MKPPILLTIPVLVIAASVALTPLAVDARASDIGAEHARKKKAKKPRKCRLPGRTVGRTDEIRVTARGRKVFACAKRVGRTFTLAGDAFDTGYQNGFFLHAAGRMAITTAADYEFGDPPYVSTKVTNVRTDRALYRLARYTAGQRGTQVERVFARPSGAAVAVISTGTAPLVPVGLTFGKGRFVPDGVRVVSFARRGRQKILDEGPPGSIPPVSLTLQSGAVEWFHDGQVRYGTP